jgi:hypothetical protein
MLSHRPYSFNLSPSDFYVFAKVKSPLIGPEIPDEIDLLEAVIEILNGISDAELQRVFRSRTECVEIVIDAARSYLTQQIFPSSLFHSRSAPLWPV